MIPTILDVARLAGVSPATASRALSGSAPVTAAKQEKVELAARELGYRVNKWAASLRGASTGRLGLIVPDLMNPFFADLVKGAQARARETGYSLFVADTDDDPAREIDMLNSFVDRVDGVLLSTPRMRDERLAELAVPLPLVLLHRTSERFPYVITDVADGVRQAVSNLVALGHQRIGYVDGPPESWSAGLRRAALASVQLPPGVEIVTLGQVPARFEGGIAGADLVVTSGVSAVLAFNDVVALGMLNRFVMRGVRVPQDISLIGFDGIPASAMTTPSLTTVSQPLTASARIAVDMVIGLARGRDVPQRSVVLSPHLVVRESTAQPGGGLPVRATGVAAAAPAMTSAVGSQ